MTILSKSLEIRTSDFLGPPRSQLQLPSYSQLARQLGRERGGAALREGGQGEGPHERYRQSPPRPGSRLAWPGVWPWLLNSQVPKSAMYR